MNDRPKTLRRGPRRALIVALALALIGAAAWMLERTNQQKHRNAALWDAVESDDLSAVTTLLEDGADPNTHEYEVLNYRHGRSMAAILTRLRGREPTYNLDPKTSRWTADPRVPGKWTVRQKWNTVLWLATEHQRPDIVRALIAKGAKDKATGYLDTALMWASERGHKDIVQSLLASGSDVNAKNDFGDTALDGAAMQGEIEIVKLLLQHGADTNQNNTLLHSEARGHKMMVELIENARGANRTIPAREMP